MTTLTTFLQIIVFAVGIIELFAAFEYKKHNNKKHFSSSLAVGLFACLCAVISYFKII